MPVLSTVLLKTKEKTEIQYSVSAKSHVRKAMQFSPLLYSKRKITSVLSFHFPNMENWDHWSMKVTNQFVIYHFNALIFCLFLYVESLKYLIRTMCIFLLISET